MQKIIKHNKYNNQTISNKILLKKLIFKLKNSPPINKKSLSINDRLKIIIITTGIQTKNSHKLSNTLIKY